MNSQLNLISIFSYLSFVLCFGTFNLLRAMAAASVTQESYARSSSVIA